MDCVSKVEQRTLSRSEEAEKVLGKGKGFAEYCVIFFLKVVFHGTERKAGAEA
jgi:hypothetical protein